jgi:RNA polymerase sigma factor (TIGR02999 family)
MCESAKDLTGLLNQTTRDAETEDRLFRLLEQRFRRIAASRMRHERPDHSLQATALTHDTFLKLMRGQPRDWQNREQFFSAAARVMRQLLVDHARIRCADKRGGKQRDADIDKVPDMADRSAMDPAMIVAINDATEKLEQEYPEVFQVFNLHFFSGFELKEIAEDILQTSYTTVKRRWKMARAFLHRELMGNEPDGEEPEA